MYQLDAVNCNNKDERLCMFLQWKKANKGIGWNAMKGHIFAVKNFWLQKGINVQTAKTKGFIPRAWAVVAAEKRERPTGKGADPITITELKALLEAIDKMENLTAIAKKAWKVIFTLAFFGCKRISEYANRLSKEGGQGLRMEQIEFEYSLASGRWKESTYYILNRTHGKTSQFGEDLYAIYTCAHEDGVCPVCIMKEYLEDRIQKNDIKKVISGYLVEQGRAFNKYQVGATLRKATVLAKVEHKVSHSFRKGGAQYAVNKGVPRTAIQRQADWKSEKSLNRYYGNINRQESMKVWKKHLK